MSTSTGQLALLGKNRATAQLLVRGEDTPHSSTEVPESCRLAACRTCYDSNGAKRVKHALEMISKTKTNSASMSMIPVDFL
jgi:hypothetical protein